MARFRQRRGSGLIPVVSNKEVIDSTVLLAAAAVTTDVDIATAVNGYIGTIGTCPLASSIKGFYLEISYNLNQNIVGAFDWYLAKRQLGQPASAYPVPGTTGGDPFRKRIFHERKGVLDGGNGSNIGGQTSKSVEFIAIPKSFKKMSENDVWFLRFRGTTNYSFCLKAIYKWYA